MRPAALDLLPNEEPWMDDGACLTAPAPATPTAAKAICVACPVLTDCATYADEHDQRYGIWGGLTRAERDLVRRVALA